MNIPPILVSSVCSHCGAESQTKEGKCWLCYEDKSLSNPYEKPNVPVLGQAIAPQTIWDTIAMVLLAICLVLTLLIGAGFAVQDKGLLIPFAICLGPAYLVTFIRGASQIGATGKPRAGSLFLTFVVSLLATVLVATILLVCSAILLFLICINAFGK